MPDLIIKVERPAYGGLSIGRHEGKVVMVKGAALLGETVEVAVENVRKDYLTASVKNIIEPSPRRIVPACKYFGTCGGCHLQHIPYELQISLKQEILKDCLRRQAKTDVCLSDPMFDDVPWNYRLRGQFKASREGVGFYRENSREVIDIDSCSLMKEKINTILAKVKPLVRDSDIKEIHITDGDRFTALIKLSSFKKSTSGPDTLSAMFMSLGFSGLCIETQDKKISCYGNAFTTLNLLNLKYCVSPMTFFQSHWRLNQRVAGFIKDHLASLKGKKVLDLYSGAGNFSIPLALEAEVTAVEGNPCAIKDGMKNVEINRIKSCRFIASSAEDFNAQEKFDVVILDPPRAGLTNSVLNKILTLSPATIVYISCNPATLARDLKKLLMKYDIESIRLIDFFPQTFHIESLVFLRLK